MKRTNIDTYIDQPPVVYCWHLIKINFQQVKWAWSITNKFQFDFQNISTHLIFTVVYQVHFHKLTTTTTKIVPYTTSKLSIIYDLLYARASSSWSKFSNFCILFNSISWSYALVCCYFILTINQIWVFLIMPYSFAHQ